MALDARTFKVQNSESCVKVIIVIDVMYHRKVGDLREEVRQWWASLKSGEKLFWNICGLNVLVFLGWRLPALQPFMMKWFLSSPDCKIK